MTARVYAAVLLAVAEASALTIVGAWLSRRSYDEDEMFIRDFGVALLVCGVIAWIVAVGLWFWGTKQRT